MFTKIKNWWGKQPKQKRWVICMLMAFCPLAIMAIVGEFATLSMWVFMPVACVCMVFACMAYGIRISK